MSTRIVLLAAGAALACSVQSEGPLAADLNPSSQSLKTLEAKLDKIGTTLQFLTCILLEDDAGSENRCATIVETNATDAIANAMKPPNVDETKPASTAVADFSKKVVECAGIMGDYVRSERDVGQIRLLEENCSEEKLRAEAATTEERLVEALSECASDASELGEFIADNKNRSGIAIIGEAVAQPEISKGAAECVREVGRAADAFVEGMAKLASAAVNTLQFCLAVPEPTACTIFGLIQLVLLVLQSGSGEGDGDGNGGQTGNSDETRPAAGTPGTEGSGAASPTPSGRAEEMNVKLETGDGCRVEIDHPDLVCGQFRAPRFFEGAEFWFPDGIAAERRRAIQQALANARTSIDQYFGNIRGKLLADGKLRFCVRVVPGLDGVLRESMTAQRDRPAEDIRTGVLLTPDSGNPGSYLLIFDHAGHGC